MKMAMKDGQILIKEADQNQFMVIKSWNKMKWKRGEQMLVGTADLELLNKLAGLIRLPQPIEQQRQHLIAIQGSVNAERMNPNPVPLVTYPVKLKLFQHQVRGANMAMITFGLVCPKKLCRECGCHMDAEVESDICECCQDDRRG